MTYIFGVILPFSSDGVDFIDVNDRRGPLPGFLEQVPYPGGPHATDHLNKLGTVHGEEGNVTFVGNCLSQQGLATT